MSENVRTGRDAAYEAVLSVLARRTFVGETLGLLRDRDQLDRRESSLATEIALGAVRHIYAIEPLLSRVATYHPQSVGPELKAVVYCAAYQLLWMDRVPAFAAVNEAVELAHRKLPRKAAPMVNALLRRLTDAIAERGVAWAPTSLSQIRTSWGQACAFNRDVLPADDEQTRLAIQVGERPSRLRTLTKRFGAGDAEKTAWASQAEPALVLQRNAARIEPDAFQSLMRQTFGDDVACDADAAFLSAGSNVIDTDAFRAGLVFVQDATARLAATLVRAEPGERVLDYCAAPGGKTMTIAAQMRDEGEVMACDVAPDRLVQVSANADRLGLQCVRTRLIDAHEAEAFERSFDAAIVDAPCSNTGVLARRPEARLGLTRRKTESLTRLQNEILRRAAACVRPGGRLIYSTCCLEPAENDGVVAAFVADQPEWSCAEQHLSLPQWGPGPADWRDGGFAARLERSA